MVPRRCRIGRQGDLVRQIDAGIEFRPVGAEIEIENLREQDDAVQIDIAIGRELVCDHG